MTRQFVAISPLRKFANIRVVKMEWITLLSMLNGYKTETKVKFHQGVNVLGIPIILNWNPGQLHSITNST